MNRRKKQAIRIFQRHPRYGDAPIPSGLKFTKEEIERGHWRYSTLEYFPETAIPADLEKQNYAVYPRPIYVDLVEYCLDCKKPFIFYAREQKYWFETLGFWVDAHCTRCHPCRQSRQHVQRLLSLYEKLKTQEVRDKHEKRTLKHVALELYQLGYIKNLQLINEIDL